MLGADQGGRSDDRPGGHGRSLDILPGGRSLWRPGAPAIISIRQRRAALYEHMALARRYGGEGHALHFVRKFMMWYSRGLPGASGLSGGSGRFGGRCG